MEVCYIGSLVTHGGSYINVDASYSSTCRDSRISGFSSDYLGFRTTLYL